MTPCYPSYFSIYDLDLVDELDLREMIDRCEEIAAKNATPVSGIATDRAAGLDLWADDITEDVFPSITVIQPSQEDLTGSLADRWTDDRLFDDYRWFDDE